MKRIFCLVFISLFLSCSTDRVSNNPFLQDIGFRFDLDLNLPLYSPLTNTGSAVFVENKTAGLRGIFVINTGFDTFMAWEASCPNHVPNECSTMILKGQTVTCSCEGYEYSLYTGQLLNRPEDSGRYYDLLFYRSTFNGNVISVFN